MKKEDENEIMDVEKGNQITSQHSENLLFSPNKNEMDEDEESSSSNTKGNASFSVSDRFGDVSNESVSDDEFGKDNSNYKLGKRATNFNNPPKEKKNKKEKVKAIENTPQKAVDTKVFDLITTIDSDNEEEREKQESNVNGFIAGDLEEFLQHYQLTQFEESFRKNHLEKVSAFHLISLQDLNDMGFLAADLLKWKKFNPALEFSCFSS